MAAGWSPFGSKGETTWRFRAGGGEGRRGGKNWTGVIWFIAHPNMGARAPLVEFRGETGPTPCGGRAGPGSYRRLLLLSRLVMIKVAATAMPMATKGRARAAERIWPATS